VLTLEGLDVYYGEIHALRDAALEVRRGEIVALLGNNGSGKSTTLKTISGLLAPRRGRIRLDDESIAGTPAHTIVLKGIAHVPEGRRIFNRLTVRENLMMGAYLRTDDGVTADLAAVFELFPRLKERIAQVAGTLSGGEQQMLAIGRALMSAPRLLMCDEPSLGLAPLVTAEIMRLLARLRRDGTTVLLVEQNARAALKIADRAYVLDTGEVTLSGPAADLLDNQAVKAAYLGG
jgi:branched-chain amino acid transport system ATP-binding protein